MFDATTIRTLPLPNETDLLTRVAEGDEKAFGMIFHHYRPKIYSYAFHLFRNIGLADELVQEVFLKVWLNRDKLPHLLKFESWVFIIARNQVFDTLKALAKEASALKQMAHLLDPEANLVEDQFLDKENELRLQQALDHLSPQQKLIFTLSRHQGMKHEEIASRLNVSRKSIETYRARSREKLGLKTRADIVRYAIQTGMLNIEAAEKY